MEALRVTLLISIIIALTSVMVSLFCLTAWVLDALRDAWLDRRERRRR